MPTRGEIQEDIIRRKNASQDEVRRRYVADLSAYTKRDTVVYASAFTSKGPLVPPTALALTLDDLQGFMASLHGLKGDALDLFLHSPGGSMEAADQLVQYLRAKYKRIRAIVPQNAMSASTMIACACDSIVMGKHSAIGPIDPQVTFPTSSGAFTAPAQAILDEFEQAKREIATNPASIPLWATKVQAYPHGFLTMCETTLRLAREKVHDWLSCYMFKEDPARDQKSTAIADWLGDAKEHKTHGRPITIDQARARGLVVECLEDDQELQERVLSVFHAVMVTFQVTSCVKMVENQNGKGVYTTIQVTALPIPAGGQAG
jgi:hypothetical protein